MAKQVYTYSSAEDRVNEHRKRVGDDVDTSIEFMSPDSLLDAVNSIERRIINAPFSGMNIDREGKITVPGNGKGWDFMEDDTQFSFIGDLDLAASIAKGSTGNAQLSDTSGFDNEPGAVIVYDPRGTWDFITYQSVLSPNLQTLGHVTIGHSSGERVSKLYKLPTDFARAKFLVVNGDEMYEGKQDPDPDFFCTYNGFLWMPRNFGISSGVLQYWKQRTVITDISASLNIPDILDPVLDSLLDARAFKLQGDMESMVNDCLFDAADALRSAMGYTTSTSNKRIRLARAMPRSPVYPITGTRINRFDEGNYN